MKASYLRIFGIAALAGVVLGGLVLAWNWNMAPRISTSSSEPTSEASVTQPPVQAQSTSPLPSPIPTRVSRSEPTLDKAFREFQDRFGQNLEPTSRDGRLLSARGTLGQGKESADFRPNDSAKVRARAQEIVDAASGLLGIRAEMPLGDPIVADGEVTAQVTYRQTFDGLPVAPQGAVRVDLGPKGELLSIESNYQPGLRVTNSFRLPEPEARQKAIAGAGEPGDHAEGGNRMIWIISRPGAAAEGRYAYQYSIRGQQVVVDAGDGTILFRRNRRTD